MTAAAPAASKRALPELDRATLAVLGLTLAAFALRASQLDQGLFGDELFTYDDVHARSLDGTLDAVREGHEDNPPLFFVLAWASAQLGDPTQWIRLPSLILGTATVPLVYALGRDTVGWVAGLIGATMLALSPFAQYYGVEARPYATMAFFVALATLALVRAVESRSRGWWALYAVSAAGAAYSHYTCVFVLLVQALWSLWRCRDRLREPLLANALVVLLYSPWLVYLRDRPKLEVIGLLRDLSVGKVLEAPPQALVGHPVASLRAIPTVAGLVAIGACAGLGVGALARAARAPSPAHHRSGLGLLGALALATPLGLLVYSLVQSDLWGSRGLWASVPAAALVLGALVAALPRRWTAVAGAVVAVVLIVGTIRSFEEAHRRPAMRDVARFVEARARPGAAVVYTPVFGSSGPLSEDLGIYLRGPLPVVKLPAPGRLAEVWRRAPQVLVVGPRLGTGVLAPSPPPSQRRPLTASAEFRGAVRYVVYVYGAAR